MKKLPALFLAPLVFAPALFAQTAPDPSSPFGLTPSTPSPSGASDLPLIPDAMPALDKSPLADREKARKDKTAVSEDALRQKIKMREAKTKALRDPAIQAEWDKSVVAKTDYEKREILKGYYKLLYARMLQIDGTLKTEIEAQKGAHIGDLTQSRITPTVPPQVARAGGN